MNRTILVQTLSLALFVVDLYLLTLRRQAMRPDGLKRLVRQHEFLMAEGFGFGRFAIGHVDEQGVNFSPYVSL